MSKRLRDCVMCFRVCIGTDI